MKTYGNEPHHVVGITKQSLAAFNALYNRMAKEITERSLVVLKNRALVRGDDPEYVPFKGKDTVILKFNETCGDGYLLSTVFNGKTYKYCVTVNELIDF